MFKIFETLFYVAVLIVCSIGIISCCIMAYKMYAAEKKLRWMLSLDELVERDNAVGNFRVNLSPAEHAELMYYMSLDRNDPDSIKKVSKRFFLSDLDERRFIEILFQYKEIRLQLFDLETEWEYTRYGERLGYWEKRDIIDAWMGIIYDFNIDEIEVLTSQCARNCGNIIDLYFEVA